MDFFVYALIAIILISLSIGLGVELDSLNRWIRKERFWKRYNKEHNRADQ